MSNEELQKQQARCEIWNDPSQWEMLAVAFYQRGYNLNALYCFRRADEIRDMTCVVSDAI